MDQDKLKREYMDAFHMKVVNNTKKNNAEYMVFDIKLVKRTWYAVCCPVIVDGLIDKNKAYEIKLKQLELRK